MRFDAPGAEVARRLRVRAGYLHLMDMELHLVTPVADLVSQVENALTVS